MTVDHAPTPGPVPGTSEWLQAMRDRWAVDAAAGLPIATVRGGPVSVEDADSSGADDLARALSTLDQLRGQVEAEMARVVGIAAERGVVYSDGHRSEHGWVRTCTQSGRGRSRELVSRARLIAEQPWVGESLWAGRLTVEHVEELVRAWSNPRVRLVFGDFRAEFLAMARDLPFDEFCRVVRHWVALADQDGADRTKDADHGDRFLSWRLGADGNLRLRGQIAGVAALELDEIMRRFLAAERLADWDAARASRGDDATAADLPRRGSQQAIDALVAMGRQAVEAPPGSKAPNPVVNLVIDWETVEEWLAAVVGDLAHPVPLRQRLCQTIDGAPVDAADVFAALIEGSIRVVAIDAARHPVAISSVQRCFTPQVRDALRALCSTCQWPGCERPSSTTETDHLLPWSEDGPTAASNGAPVCGFHNRWRHRNRYRVWKDPAGGFHTFRPDGTEMRVA